MNTNPNGKWDLKIKQVLYEKVADDEYNSLKEINLNM